MLATDAVDLISHPTRRAAIELAVDRGMRSGKPISATELAKRLDEPVKDVAYHVAKLARRGVLTQVGEERVRGGLRKDYAATPLAVGLLNVARRIERL